MAAMERQSNVDEAICAAIAEKRLISFELNVHKLFFYQVGGESQSGPPIGWRWAVIAQVSSLKILNRPFAGPRPAPSGRHAQWDELIATVSPRS
jgi:hypothetical protein